MAGEVQDTSKKSVLKQIEFADSYQEEEIISLALKDVGLIWIFKIDVINQCRF